MGYNIMKIRNVMFALGISFFLVACSDVFEYHPYDVKIGGEKGINAKNIAKIEAQFKNKDTLRIAIMSDSHEWYQATKECISDINSRDSIDFVIHCGDLTDCGTTKEYEWMRDIMSRFKKPYVCLIGNHDFLGTGDEVYNEIFGKTDFSFIAGRIKFLCLNTNGGEYDYLAAIPNLDYMEEQMTADSADFDRTIILMHAAPFTEQFNNNVAKAFEHYVNLFPGLMFCVAGHAHSISREELYNDGVVYYGIDCMDHHNYYIFTITPTGYSYEIVYF